MLLLKDIILGFYGWTLGLWLYLWIRIFHWSCRFEFYGAENLKTSPNHLFVTWHKNNIPFFVSFVKFNRFVWMTHSAAYVKPLHVLLKLFRAEKIIMGSSGHQGREAADELVKFLKDGYSTQFTPDGPGGPPQKAHNGVLHIAVQSQIPIISVVIQCENRLKLNFTWDQKQIPLPFSRIKVFFGPELRVSDVNEETLSFLEKLLNAKIDESGQGQSSLSL